MFCFRRDAERKIFSAPLGFAARRGNLTESSKSPASIAKSNKQWVGTCLYQEESKLLLISWAEQLFGYQQVAKRIANIRLIYKDDSMFRSLVLSSRFMMQKRMYSPSRHSKEEQSRIMSPCRMQASKTS